jgi:hypothetical protein
MEARAAVSFFGLPQLIRSVNRYGPPGTFLDRLPSDIILSGSHEMEQNPKANPGCSACHGTGIVVCDHGGEGRFVVEQKCECVTELPWYAINDPGAESEA